MPRNTEKELVVVAKRVYYHRVLESRNRTGSTGSRNPENKKER